MRISSAKERWSSSARIILRTRSWKMRSKSSDIAWNRLWLDLEVLKLRIRPLTWCPKTYLSNPKMARGLLARDHHLLSRMVPSRLERGKPPSPKRSSRTNLLDKRTLRRRRKTGRRPRLKRALSRRWRRQLLKSKSLLRLPREVKPTTSVSRSILSNWRVPPKEAVERSGAI